MSVTEEMLMAHADGELSADDRAMVDAAVAADPALAARLALHQRLRSRISGAYQPVMEEPVPERLLNAARPSNVVDLAARRSRIVRWGAMAACLVAGVLVGVGVPRGGDPMQARGDLAAALDTQLASTQSDEAIRIGLTFRDGEGALCRTYTAPKQAGLACREEGDWRIRMAVAHEQVAGPDFRTAAAETPAPILAAVEGMIAGEPMDAEAEAAALNAD